MIHTTDIGYQIDYSDFMLLINNGGWKLNKGFKDNWIASEYVEYICELFNNKADLTVFFVVDRNSLDYIRKIDVLIFSNSQASEGQSETKHIQFVNFQPFKSDEE
jgi:hypothetical protein